ncbi:ribonuclease P protein component [Paracoccus sp. R12_1]|uniref:ribonuclease P protein component n=1 Tax=unclassified Paracoccus (in: a-proteobacteria) TaxID=2688777 RepID=UPI001ADA0079|nr:MULTISPECIES: ribonuclease P protein component [unclassified Paracoccus (in: a-proteobacteria)]MBO9455545.1 ribonuclease P protein component [Paracoccus sp. R12_2]MBO9486215.1 ribonuclease P protein component [Paracoccus sp. R12_1]
MAAFRMSGRPNGMPPVLRKRAEFLAAAKARRQGTPGFLLQARRRADDGPARVGFTCSKKVGNAVLRNRAKRRLREIARLCLPDAGMRGWDYVLIGRPGVTVSRDFTAMRDDLSRALRKIHS